MTYPVPRSRRNIRWSADRVARLGFLIGAGLDARDVARDPGIASNAANIRRQARRFGLRFRATGAFRLPHAVLGRIDAAALCRRVTRDDLIHQLLLNAGSDDGLIDNILDDGP